MKSIRFKIECNFKGKKYKVGDIYKHVKKEDMPSINRLNERGFIEPLTKTELIEISESLNKSNKEEKE